MAARSADIDTMLARRAARVSRSNTARGNRRAVTPRTFVGVDGEGVTRADGTHDYVLLSIGERSLHRNGLPLTFDHVAEFLWDYHVEYPAEIMVGFYLTYDFTMWFKWLPEDRARMLLTDAGAKQRIRKFGKNPVPFPVYYGDWEMDFHAGKRFKLRRAGSKSWLYVCDSGPFFQSSFLAVIDPTEWPEPVVTDAEYQTIHDGKQNRQSATFDRSMMRYNVLENDVLARVMGKLDEGFRAMDVRLQKTQWYGPGQAAQAWMNLIKAPTKDDVQNAVPFPVLIACQESYYGGWFEIMAHGHLPGTTYEYDINSAYPKVIAALPCLEHGEWRRNDTTGTHTIVCATVRQDGDGANSGRRIGAMPHRTNKGAILRPRLTRGWFWKHELQASQRAGCIDQVTVHDSWSFHPACPHEPFDKIAGLYRQRQTVGKNTPMGRALKLVYNSSYGKVAQSVGEPRYANPVYASLITAGCRTMVWDAIATHPMGTDAVTMVATDGVFFTSPHPGLPLSDRLGDWSEARRENLCQFMPGLYWDDTTRAKDDGKIRSRGISAKDLRSVVDRLDAKWTSYPALRFASGNEFPQIRKLIGNDRFEGIRDAWPGISVPISFGMISAKLALHRNDWATAGTVSPKPRYLSGNPSDKRDASTTYQDDAGRLWTMPYGVAPDGRLNSVPYDKRFGLELRDQFTEDEIITPDGTADDELYEYLHGHD